MTAHDIISRVDGIRCRCGETFASVSAHEAHWALEAARVDAPAGLAAARAALEGGS